MFEGNRIFSKFRKIYHGIFCGSLRILCGNLWDFLVPFMGIPSS